MQIALHLCKARRTSSATRTRCWKKRRGTCLTSSHRVEIYEMLEIQVYSCYIRHPEVKVYLLSSVDGLGDRYLLSFSFVEKTRLLPSNPATLHIRWSTLIVKATDIQRLTPDCPGCETPPCRRCFCFPPDQEEIVPLLRKNGPLSRRRENSALHRSAVRPEETWPWENASKQ